MVECVFIYPCFFARLLILSNLRSCRVTKLLEAGVREAPPFLTINMRYFIFFQKSQAILSDQLKQISATSII